MNTTNLDPLPQRQGFGKRNLDLFLLGSRATPICFYFEDEGCEELYTRFLRRIFPTYAKPLVICTGGKTKKQVLADVDTHRLAQIVYLQDKDFDDLIGTLPTDPRVVTLNRYSFENYLVEADALIELAVESKRRLRREDAVQLLALDAHLPSLYSSYRPLVALFVTARKLNLKGIKTTKQPIFNLLTPNSLLVSDADVARFRECILNAALAAQRISTAEDLQPLIEPALEAKLQYREHADADPNSHLCGKHLLDLVLLYIDRRIGTSLSKVDRFEVAMRLVLHVSIARFGRVRSAIQSSLAKQGASPETLALFV